MGIMDEIEKVAQKAQDLAEQHPEQVKKALDKAEKVLDEQTSGKFHDQIQTVGDKAESLLGKGKQSPS